MVRQFRGLRDWGVGIISTDYDLRRARTSVIDKVTRLGFLPVAFDSQCFPVQPNLHSHDACIKAIEAMDIVILLIDRRYGGLYLGKGPQSITEREFRKALLLKKPIIPCVSKKAFDDRGRCKKEVKELVNSCGIDQNEAKRRVRPTYVDNWRVIDFIDTIQHSKRDQFMIIFDDLPMLLRCIEDRLKVTTPHVCQLIAHAQSKSIDSYRSTSDVFSSIGIGASIDLFVEPPHRIVAGSKSHKKTSTLLESMKKDEFHIVLTGQPGMGKSITLARGFRNHANQAVKNKSFRIPFFVSLRGRGIWYHFNFERYLTECCAELLKKKLYPALYLHDVKPVFYMDGLDESAISPTVRQFQKAVSSDMLNSAFVLTMRSSFARQAIGQYNPLGSIVDKHVELQRWSKKQALAFADNFFNYSGEAANKEWLLNFIKETPPTHPIIESPLLLSLFLWLGVTNDVDILKNKELGLASLFSWFLSSWASRELNRYVSMPYRMPQSTSEEDVTLLIRAWELAAWRLFRGRQERQILALGELQKSILGKLPRHKAAIVKTAAFTSLFTIAEQSRMVTGMIHEQFLEYLIARAFVGGCLGNQFPLAEYLSHQINVDVTRFVKSIWASMSSDDLEKILRRLRYIAKTQGRGEDPISLMINANCVYYISRIPLPKRSQSVLRELLQGEERLYSRNGILFALVRLGDMEAEELLYQVLMQNREADMINRGLHLEYFKDSLSSPRGIPPRDDGVHEWDNTLQVLLSHIESTKPRELYSRRIDILTIRTFLRSRGKLGPFSENSLKRIRRSVRSREMRRLIGTPAATNVEAEFNLLSAQVQKLKPKQ